jgi:hypothetical protein
MASARNLKLDLSLLKEVIPRLPRPRAVDESKRKPTTEPFLRKVMVARSPLGEFFARAHLRTARQVLPQSTLPIFRSNIPMKRYPFALHFR